MKTVSDIKKEHEDKVSAVFKEYGVFFAFSTSQFNENKTPLDEGDKYVSIGAGGYCPKSKAKAMWEAFDAIDVWFKQSIKANKARRKYIAYELANHEAYYTCSIESTLEALGEDYTSVEVLAVYTQERKKQSV